MAETLGSGGGFFGGLSQGIGAARAQQLEEDKLAAVEANKAKASAVSQIEATITHIKEVAKAAAASGNDPKKILSAVQPLIASAQGLAQAAGIDPQMIQQRAVLATMQPIQSTPENQSHQLIKVTGAMGEGDKLVRLEKTTGKVVPINPATGMPLTESDVITPRQAQVVNPTLGQPPILGTPGQPTAQVTPFTDRFSAVEQQPSVTIPPAKDIAGLSGDTIDLLARQVINGNDRAFSGTPRGKEGNAIRAAIMNRVGTIAKAENISAERLNAAISEYKAFQSGQRKTGERAALVDLAATEFQLVAPVLLDASEKVDRTKYSDVNKIILSYLERSGDPSVVQFGGALNTVVNVYARAVSPTGQVTVSDKDHAREILQKAWSNGQIKAAVEMLNREVEAALKSPKKALQHQRETYSSGVPTSRLTAESLRNSVASSEPSGAPAMPKVNEERDGYRYSGGNPADPSNWVKVR